MALTLNQIVGFETGGLEEASATNGSPDATEATIVNSGGSERSLNLGTTTNTYYEINPFSEVSSAGNDHIFGFAYYFATGVTPSSAVDFALVRDESQNVILDLSLQTDGTIDLNDDNNTTLATTSAISAATWGYIEVYFQNVGSSASWEFFHNGTSIGSGSSGDFLSTGSIISEIRFITSGNLDGNYYVDDFYWLSGATAASDRLGSGFHVRGFQSGAATTTADYDIVTGGTGVTGNWANAGERPLNASNIVSIDGTYAITYNDTNSGGAGPGINSGSGSLPTANYEVVGAKWWWNIDRTTGAGRTHQTARGNTGDGATTDTGLNSVIDTTAINYFLIDNATATPVPLVTEDFVQGFGQTSTSGQDTDCYEQMAMIAWVTEPTQPTLSALSDGHMGTQRSFHGPFEKS